MLLHTAVMESATATNKRKEEKGTVAGINSLYTATEAAKPRQNGAIIATTEMITELRALRRRRVGSSSRPTINMNTIKPTLANTLRVVMLVFGNNALEKATFLPALQK